MNDRYNEHVSSETPELIRANECEWNIGTLVTYRFRRLWNEIVDLREKLESARCSALVRESWQPIETAPKDRKIQLWVPALGIFVDGPWRGGWSYMASQWVLDTPFREPDGRGVSVSEIPNPTHWMPLPPAPNEENGDS
jgi:hypothetical protein